MAGYNLPAMTESEPLSDLPPSVRPAVPPPPPGYQSGIAARVTGPLLSRDTRPLAWTEAAQKLGQVEPMAIEGSRISIKKGWGLKNPFDILKKKIESFKKG